MRMVLFANIVCEWGTDAISSEPMSPVSFARRRDGRPDIVCADASERTCRRLGEPSLYEGSLASACATAMSDPMLRMRCAGCFFALGIVRRATGMICVSPAGIATCRPTSPSRNLMHPGERGVFDMDRNRASARRTRSYAYR